MQNYARRPLAFKTIAHDGNELSKTCCIQYVSNIIQCSCHLYWSGHDLKRIHQVSIHSQSSPDFKIPSGDSPFDQHGQYGQPCHTHTWNINTANALMESQLEFTESAPYPLLLLRTFKHFPGLGSAIQNADVSISLCLTLVHMELYSLNWISPHSTFWNPLRPKLSPLKRGSAHESKNPANELCLATPKNMAPKIEYNNIHIGILVYSW